MVLSYRRGYSYSVQVDLGNPAHWLSVELEARAFPFRAILALAMMIDVTIQMQMDGGKRAGPVKRDAY